MHWLKSNRHALQDFPAAALKTTYEGDWSCKSESLRLEGVAGTQSTGALVVEGRPDVLRTIEANAVAPLAISNRIEHDTYLEFIVEGKLPAEIGDHFLGSVSFSSPDSKPQNVEVAVSALTLPVAKWIPRVAVLNGTTECIAELKIESGVKFLRLECSDDLHWKEDELRNGNLRFRLQGKSKRTPDSSSNEFANAVLMLNDVESTVKLPVLRRD